MSKKFSSKLLRLTRFSLKTFLMVTVLIGIVVGPWCYRSTKQKAAVTALTAIGGEFRYRHQVIKDPKKINALTSGQFNHDVELGPIYSVKEKPFCPEWILRLIGDDYFVTPIHLTLRNPNGIEDDGLTHLKSLHNLEEAFIDCPVAETDIANFKHQSNLRILNFTRGNLLGPHAPNNFDFLHHLQKLQILDVSRSAFGNRDAKHLAGLTDLRILYLNNTQIDDDGLINFANLDRLKHLGLWGNNISYRGIEHLVGLTRLEYLSLAETNVDDSAIPLLAALKSLNDVELFGSKMSKQGIDQLRELMPQCRINGKTFIEISDRNSSNSPLQ